MAYPTRLAFCKLRLLSALKTRYTPRLSFEIDLGVKKSLEVGQILADLAREREELAAKRLAEGITEPAISESGSMDENLNTESSPQPAVVRAGSNLTSHRCATDDLKSID